MPFALLNGSTCGSWACTHSKSFDQHFETKYPPGFSTLFEAYNASPNSLDLTDIAEVDTYSVSGSLEARARAAANRAGRDGRNAGEGGERRDGRRGEQILHHSLHHNIPYCG